MEAQKVEGREVVSIKDNKKRKEEDKNKWRWMKKEEENYKKEWKQNREKEEK